MGIVQEVEEPRKVRGGPDGGEREGRGAPDRPRGVREMGPRRRPGLERARLAERVDRADPDPSGGVVALPHQRRNGLRRADPAERDEDGRTVPRTGRLEAGKQAGNARAVPATPGDHRRRGPHPGRGIAKEPADDREP